jgi:hypothetical protein
VAEIASEFARMAGFVSPDARIAVGEEPTSVAIPPRPEQEILAFSNFTANSRVGINNY